MRQLAHNSRELPAEPAEGFKGEATARQSSQRPGVLVVDDEHMLRIMVQLGLEQAGFDVWLASNGREALDLYQEHRDRITVVLLDVSMPDLDGPQTLDALRQLNPEVQACFMSGNPGPYNAEDLLQAGAAAFLAKPFYIPQLIQMLQLLEPPGKP